MDENYWSKIYSDLSLDKIPWEIKLPPKELVSVVDRQLIPSNSSILDVGCGSGNYSIFLAKLGFKVTGVDISKEALKIAQSKAANLKVSVDFLHSDALNLSKNLKTKFDFILDYSLLHHISFAQINSYVNQFNSLLTHNGKLLLVCYSERDSEGKKILNGKFGNTMYYRTAQEIRLLYSFLTELEYSETTLGKQSHHFGHYFLFQKTI